VITQAPGKDRLAPGLRGKAAKSGDHAARLIYVQPGPRHLGGKGEDRLEQTDVLVADFELRRMNPDRKPADSRIEVVPDEGGLAPLVPFPSRPERERDCGDRLSPQEVPAAIKAHCLRSARDLPSARSGRPEFSD